MLDTPRPRGHRLRRAGLALLASLSLTACTTVSSLNSAARNIDTFALNPLPLQANAPGGSRLLFVAEPTAAGAIGSDRIVMRPNPLEVTLLADGRWVEPATAHLRSVIARSFANTGRFAFVSTATVGPLPDVTLLVDMEAFEAELLPAGGAPARVVVALTFTVVRDADNRLVASRRFSRTAQSADTDALAIVGAFEAATSALLRDAVPWATTAATGVPRS